MAAISEAIMNHTAVAPLPSGWARIAESHASAHESVLYPAKLLEANAEAHWQVLGFVVFCYYA